MRLAFAVAVTVCATGLAAAEAVSPSKQRPASVAERSGRAPPQANGSPAVTSLAPAVQLHDLPFGDLTSSPSACDLRLAEIAEFKPLPGLVGPGECGAAGVVRLDAVKLREGTRVPLSPPATLRCPMAEALAHFIRNDMAPATSELGAPLAAVVNYDSYDCRGRNRVSGAKISEHGKGNAIDIRAVKLTNGNAIELTSPIVSKSFRERVRLAACGRFSTVLGPGSDGYHESHVHFDLAERRHGHRMCQWDVRERPVAADVPLPPPRPSALARDDEQ
jgi:hypothetical protein